MDSKQIIKRLKSFANPKNVAGMARFGINPKSTLGIPIPKTRKLAKEIGKDHKLAGELWKTGIHEARILAGMIDDPRIVTEKQMDSWVKDFDSWDICDQVCSNLFDKTPYAYGKAKEWTASNREFTRRAGFVLMAVLAVHDKKALDSKFLPFFALIKKYSADDRNFVKKAVNWALRQMAKARPGLRKKAIETAKELQRMDSKSAKWIASDALRELEKR